MDRIEHEGRVTDISEDVISVEIINKSACASCHAKGVCAASEESVRIVEVPYTISTLVEEYKVGDKVNVVLQPSLGIKAVWICYVIPLAVLLASILVFSKAGMSELATGLWSLEVLAVYYFVVFLFRKRISKIFTFSIYKSND